MSKKKDHYSPILAARWGRAAAALDISTSFLAKLVKDGKIRPPITVPGSRGIRLFSWERLCEDFQAWLDEAEDGSGDSWDDA